MYVYGFFFQFTAIEVLNYASVFLGALVYLVVMNKFVALHRVVPETSVA